MSGYIKKEDVIKRFEQIYGDLIPFRRIIEDLPTTEIKQDRLEILINYCRSKDDCKGCPIEENTITCPISNMSDVELNEAIEEIQEALRKC